MEQKLKKEKNGMRVNDVALSRSPPEFSDQLSSSFPEEFLWLFSVQNGKAWKATKRCRLLLEGKFLLQFCIVMFNLSIINFLNCIYVAFGNFSFIYVYYFHIHAKCVFFF